MNPPTSYFLKTLAEEHQNDLLREAEQHRLRREARRNQRLNGRTRRRFQRWS